MRLDRSVLVNEQLSIRHQDHHSYLPGCLGLLRCRDLEHLLWGADRGEWRERIRESTVESNVESNVTRTMKQKLKDVRNLMELAGMTGPKGRVRKTSCLMSDGVCTLTCKHEGYCPPSFSVALNSPGPGRIQRDRKRRTIIH